MVMEDEGMRETVWNSILLLKQYKLALVFFYQNPKFIFSNKERVKKMVALLSSDPAILG